MRNAGMGWSPLIRSPSGEETHCSLLGTNVAVSSRIAAAGELGRSSGRGGLFLQLPLWFFLFEFKSCFPVLQLQARRKRTAFFGDESGEQIGPAACHQLFHLLFWDLALQNDFADAEAATLRILQRALAGVGIFEGEYFALVTNRAG